MWETTPAPLALSPAAASLASSPFEAALDFSITTWNINSVRLRIDLVVRYLAEHQPDVLCLQETKCPDANFPHGAFRDAGYPHIAISGQKGYHGVATISQRPFSARSVRDFCAKGDARHLRVVVEDGGRGIEVCIISMCRPAATSPIPT